jgi:hypothetical protein
MIKEWQNMNKGYFDESSQDWIIPIQDKHGRMLNLRKGGIHKARDKTHPDKTNNFKVTKIVWGQQTDLAEKINFIAEILWSDGDISCWWCYYIFDLYGRWAFGQFGPMMPIADFRELYEYAHEKGII